MSEEIIEKIEVTSKHELLLAIKGGGQAGFQHIYRAAAGVCWDNDLRGFGSTEIKEWSLARWFAHIVSTVKLEMNIQLTLAEDAAWVNTPIEMQHEIENLM